MSELVPVVPQQIQAIPVGEFHDPGFWRKLKRAALRLTQEGLEQALTLYYAAQQPQTPKWARATVYAALAYFVMPLDSLPDLTPVVGYSDDLLVIAAALTTIAAHITDEVRSKARSKTRAIVERVRGSGEAVS